MSTEWSKVYNAFYGKIEKDADFFSYYNVSESEAIELATNRAKSCLIESISKLTLNCTPDVDFNDYDELVGVFNEELTNNEIDLLATLMKEVYFEKDLSLLKAFQVRFSTRDLNMFSPANERKTFTDMLNGMSKANKALMREYSSRDRLTGKLKSIDYANYRNE